MPAYSRLTFSIEQFEIENSVSIHDQASKGYLALTVMFPPDLMSKKALPLLKQRKLIINILLSHSMFTLAT